MSSRQSNKPGSGREAQSSPKREPQASLKGEPQVGSIYNAMAHTYPENVAVLGRHLADLIEYSKGTPDVEDLYTIIAVKDGIISVRKLSEGGESC